MDVLTTTASQFQEQLRNGTMTSIDLVNACLSQIQEHNHSGMHLNALINVAPTEILHQQARQLDEERAAGKLRGPLHGIPIVIKDIIQTAPELGLPTTCGAYAFRNTFATKNAPIAQRLLDAGLLIFGKTNLNEYCRMRDVKSGWSCLGSQTQSPYIPGGLVPGEKPVGNTTVSGSSSGSAAGVAAGFAPLAVGTETTGSVVIPANRAGLYSLKVTCGRVGLDGILTLSKEYDSVGGMARSAEDLRALTGALLGKEVLQRKILGKMRVGFVDARKWRFPNEYCELSEEMRGDLDLKYDKLVRDFNETGHFEAIANIALDDSDIKYDDRDLIGTVVDAQFKENFTEFAAGLTGTQIKTVEDLIQYNDEHADLALPPPFESQEDLKKVNDVKESADFVSKAVAHCKHLAGPERIDKAMEKHNIDLIIAPGDSTLFSLAARAGYPIGSVPWTTIKYDGKNSRPEGLLVIGKADSEDLILDFMTLYERFFPGRPIPAPLKEWSQV